MYLKSCPICGGEATLSEVTEDRTGYYCECYECEKSTDEFASKKAAADAWNRSRAEDLKNTDLRGTYAIVIHPIKTLWQSSFRFIFLIFGPFLAGSVLATLTPGSSLLFYMGMSVFGAVWISISAYYYIRFFKKHLQNIRRLIAKERIANFMALIFSFLLTLCIYTAVIWFAVIPYAEKCRYG